MVDHHLARSLDSGLTHESECRTGDCGACIVWGVMDASGKANPLDRKPDPDGRLVVVGWQASKHGMAPVLRHLHAAELETHEGPRYTSHFETCPNRKDRDADRSRA